MESTYRRTSFGLLAGALLLGYAHHEARAQAKPAAPPQTGSTANRVPMDRIIAVVGSDLILESDVEAEERFAAFTPLRPDAAETRDKLIERLIDRDLILQQMKLQTQTPVTDAQVDAELDSLKKNIQECAKDQCETPAGWEKFCADHGFSVDEVRQRWRTRMEVLGYIEQRFRMGIRITPAEIDAYYKNKLLPAYEKDNIPAPAESAISDRIQEILLQQQVTGLLDDWLKALRAEGSVRILDTSRDTGQDTGKGTNNRSGEGPL